MSDKTGSEIVKEFHLARGIAIDAYASYEISMVMLYSALLGAEPAYAALTFFRINNAPARIVIIEKMLIKRYDSTYKRFWDSLDGQLRRLDEERNHIVHWVALHKVDGTGTKEVVLRASIFEPKGSLTEITVQHLDDFSKKCAFYGALLGGFLGQLTHPEWTPSSWRDIFQHKVVYPPPDSHPLSRKTQERESQPPSSQE